MCSVSGLDKCNVQCVLSGWFDLMFLNFYIHSLDWKCSGRKYGTKLVGRVCVKKKELDEWHRNAFSIVVSFFLFNFFICPFANFLVSKAIWVQLDFAQYNGLVPQCNWVLSSAISFCFTFSWVLCYCYAKRLLFGWSAVIVSFLTENLGSRWCWRKAGHLMATVGLARNWIFKNCYEIF